MESQTSQFNFDRRLWNRFITVAQPYFYPVVRRGGWIFLGLLAAAMVFVVALMFFVEIGVTLAGQALFPEFFTNVAAGLVAQTERNLVSPVLWVAAVSLGLSSLCFVAVWRQIHQRWVQWVLLTFLLFLSLTVNRLNVMISFIFRFIDTALQQKEEPTFWQFLIIYGVLIISAIPILVIYRYTRLKLGLFWREWLTQYFLDRYFDQRAYYELDSNAANTEIDNPDQRMSEDVRSFTGTTLSFLLDILDSILTLYAFTGILYGISRPLALGLVIYATVGTGIAILAGRKLIKINFDQLRYEADFRYSLVHVRDNAESIAFYQGEGQELRQILERFGSALRNFNLLIIWQAVIDIFQYAYNYFTRIVPYVIVAPLYFSGVRDFGTITQATIAFSQVLSALSIVANQIQSISSFAAGINRLGAFHESLEDPALRYTRDRESTIQTRIAHQLALNNVTLLTPNSEQTLVRDLSFALEAGQRLLIVGVSGSGKSSLLRAIAGLWTNGKGSITRPDTEEMLFLPQKPYMLLGSLRDQLLYPMRRQDLTDEDLVRVLNQVNLGGLPERLDGFDAEKDWANTLSLGEQQRLAFARILITQPRYAILDEATSALDVANEKLLYLQLQHLNTTYISVGHRPSLLAYHDLVLELQGGSAWQLWSAAEYSAHLAMAS
ncbi:ABC transporter ATP-binding protein/permease [Thermostichus vulcanus]|uniref:ABC transporter ATP-binding protein/permease n=1 Tax=Thermostichus vulcanus str. 'Rupite' TaxID=2813851 RepID=A0ABT0CER5_THEVL|nr:ABC transporter ATP-binding protein/permease [Thermostichus vulcanus]MCJ2543835.1 ABC transporter ATP-binding protein/permease [Thermostichus vulcanus str. 'Rupite']